MNILVLGAAGFIGSHLCDVLLERGHSVVAVDDLSKGSLENLAHNEGDPGFSFERADARRTDQMIALGAGCDSVVDLAASKIARYGSALETVNVTFDVARSALDTARALGAACVLASTSDVYGKNPAIPFREDSDSLLGPSTGRRWAYAASKLAVEHLAFAYADEYDLPVTLLRYFGTYGERQYLNWWGGPQGVFLTAIEEGRPIEIHGDGSQTRCFIHVADLALATALAIEKPEARDEILNIGTEEEVSIAELARLMHELSGRSGPPRLEFIPYTSFTPGYEDVPRRVPDLGKSRRILGFEPGIDLRAGLSRLWSWYRA